jgi:predicted ATP-grasp superfamily ATP-dependent carboligase
VVDAPAVVAYMSYLGLGLVRALGRAGVRVFALDPHPDSLGMNSRYCTPVITPDIKENAGRYLDFLVEFGRRLPAKAVLYPTGDPTVVLFSQERELLSRYYHYVAPEHETVLKLLMKTGLASLAEAHGIPAPRTVVPADRAALEAVAGELQYPVLLKPAESHAWKAPEIVRLIGVGTKVIPCATREELLARYDALCDCRLQIADCRLKSEIGNRKSEIGDHPRVVVQEVVPGEDERLVYFCFCMSREGEPLGTFAGRKCRVLPPGLGSASYVESMWDPALAEVALRLLKAVKYRGLGGVEFKLDPRDGQYKLIELNVRFGLWDALGARCGVNLAHIAYRDALGLPVEPALHYRTGVKWVSVQRDLSAFRLYRQQGKVTTRAWLRTLCGEKMWAVFAWDDLAPFLKTTPGYLWGLLAPRLGLAR